MRWGIQSEANIDHTTTDICLKEILNSKNDSIGPYFVALLSHRYGTREIPNRIDEHEFEILREELKNIPDLDLSFKYDESETMKIDFQNIISHCYKLDENEIPRKYKLLHIDEILVGYSDVYALKIFMINFFLLILLNFRNQVINISGII